MRVSNLDINIRGSYLGKLRVAIRLMACAFWLALSSDVTNEFEEIEVKAGKQIN